ncbi:hypothetical protein VP01_2194g2 [Puccinia sorghi]|uniref:Uncharacterized protein n=1 Tax=Puccinia sorghi TaxID=27349 RepID=A0A0L6V991_9BASI|nr:hypothetical protein VP01_2194g2 [Puccinia sorghi]
MLQGDFLRVGCYSHFKNFIINLYWVQKPHLNIVDLITNPLSRDTFVTCNAHIKMIRTMLSTFFSCQIFRTWLFSIFITQQSVELRTRDAGIQVTGSGHYRMCCMCKLTCTERLRIGDILALAELPTVGTRKASLRIALRRVENARRQSWLHFDLLSFPKVTKIACHPDNGQWQLGVKPQVLCSFDMWQGNIKIQWSNQVLGKLFSWPSYSGCKFCPANPDLLPDAISNIADKPLFQRLALQGALALTYVPGSKNGGAWQLGFDVLISFPGCTQWRHLCDISSNINQVTWATTSTSHPSSWVTKIQCPIQALNLHPLAMVEYGNSLTCHWAVIACGAHDLLNLYPKYLIKTINWWFDFNTLKTHLTSTSVKKFQVGGCKCQSCDAYKTTNSVKEAMWLNHGRFYTRYVLVKINTYLKILSMVFESMDLLKPID